MGCIEIHLDDVGSRDFLTTRKACTVRCTPDSVTSRDLLNTRKGSTTASSPDDVASRGLHSMRILIEERSALWHAHQMRLLREMFSIEERGCTMYTRWSWGELRRLWEGKTTWERKNVFLNGRPRDESDTLRNEAPTVSWQFRPSSHPTRFVVFHFFVSPSQFLFGCAISPFWSH